MELGSRPLQGATPAHINVLLRQRERSQAYVRIEYIPGKRLDLSGRALIANDGRGDVVAVMETQAARVAVRVDIAGGRIRFRSSSSFSRLRAAPSPRVDT